MTLLTSAVRRARSRQSFNKNQHSDTGYGWELVRTITTADPTYTPDPGFLDGVSGVYNTMGGTLVAVRLFGDASGGTANVTAFAVADDGPLQKPNNPNNLTKSKGSHLLYGACTFSGSATANFNPITGEADSGTTWYELSAYSSTFIAADRVKEVPEGTVTSYQKLFTIDMLSDSRLFIAADTFASSLTKMLVACKIVQ